MSKVQRRQLFEAQVKAQDEMAAEYLRQQEQMQHDQLEQVNSGLVHLVLTTC